MKAFGYSLLFLLAPSVLAWNPFGGNAPERSNTDHVRESAERFAQLVANAIQDQMEYMSKNMKKAKEGVSPFFNEAYLRGNLFMSDFEVDVRDDEYFLHLDVPGVKMGDVHIHTDDSSIQVKALHECPKKHSMMPWIENEKTCIERTYESTAHLPKDADLSKMQIVFQDNVIKARIPRIRANLQHRTLQDKWEDFTHDVSEKFSDMKDGAADMLQHVADKISHGADEIKELKDEAEKKAKHGERVATRAAERAAHHVQDKGKERLDL